MDCRGGETAQPLTPRQRQGSLGGCHVAEPKVSLLSGLGRSNYLSPSHQCDIPSIGRVRGDAGLCETWLLTKVEVLAAKPFVNKHHQPRWTKKKKPGTKPGEVKVRQSQNLPEGTADTAVL